MNMYIKSIIEGLTESVTFFGNKKKQEREKWVLNEFLKYLRVPVQEIDIKGTNDEPIDVFFKDMGFQIKEIQTEGRRRDRDYKERLKSITDKTVPEDLLEDYNPVHIPLSDVIPKVTKELARHRKDKYGNNVSDINVLVYLNLCDTTYTSNPIDMTLIESELSYWKSISLVTNNCAIVISCNDINNTLLNQSIGKLYLKN